MSYCRLRALAELAEGIGSSDVNLPLAMALFVVCWVHFESIRARGIKGYFKHYFQPFSALAPINVIEEITKKSK